MRRKSSTPTISLPALSKMLGIGVSTLYALVAADLGPPVVTRGKQQAVELLPAALWVEAQLQALRGDEAMRRKIRKYEDAARHLRVEACFQRIVQTQHRRLPRRPTFIESEGFLV